MTPTLLQSSLINQRSIVQLCKLNIDEIEANTLYSMYKYMHTFAVERIAAINDQIKKLS